MGIFYLDGKFVDEDDAVLSVKDLVILRGYGVFDFLRSYNRRPFHLEDHIKRFRNSASLISLSIKESDEELSHIVQATIDKNPTYTEVHIRLLFSGGISKDGVSPAGNGKLVVMVTESYACPPVWYTQGVNVITSDSERFIPESKSINYLGAVLAQQQAKREDAVEALYVNRHGFVSEGTTTNIFLFKNGKCYTPSRLMLPGITRQVVCDLLKESYTLIERDITVDEIYDFDEILLSASNKEIVPVVSINGKQIGDGKIGVATKEVMSLFRNYTDKYGKAENE